MLFYDKTLLTFNFNFKTIEYLIFNLFFGNRPMIFFLNKKKTNSKLFIFFGYRILKKHFCPVNNYVQSNISSNFVDKHITIIVCMILWPYDIFSP